MSAYKTLAESAKSKILETNFKVFPYEWADFKKIVQPAIKKTKFKFIEDKKNEEELFVKGNVVIGRYDSYDMILYTDIKKKDFHKAVQSKKIDALKSYIK